MYQTQKLDTAVTAVHKRSVQARGTQTEFKERLISRVRKLLESEGEPADLDGLCKRLREVAKEGKNHY
jgi:hypothetical protein